VSLAGGLLFAAVCGAVLTAGIASIAWLADRIIRIFERRHGDRLPDSWKAAKPARYDPKTSGWRHDSERTGGRGW
jgi:hypothetical protein